MLVQTERMGIMKKKVVSLILAFLFVLPLAAAPVSAKIEISKEELPSEFFAAKSYSDVFNALKPKWDELGIIEAPPLAVAPCITTMDINTTYKNNIFFEFVNKPILHPECF